MHENKLTFKGQRIELLKNLRSTKILLGELDSDIIPVDSRPTPVPLGDSLFLCMVVQQHNLYIIQYANQALFLSPPLQFRIISGLSSRYDLQLAIHIVPQSREEFDILSSIEVHTHRGTLILQVKVAIHMTSPTVVGNNRKSIVSQLLASYPPPIWG